LDVNVVLDVLGEREPYVDEAQSVLAKIEAGQLEGLLAAHTVTTLHYLLAKHTGKARARRTLAALMQIVSIVPVDEDRIRYALALDWPDFEDAVQASCAEKAKADFIVTRDKRGFRGALVSVVTPGELLALE
jgi:predicted nucleic acid-binding protein